MELMKYNTKYVMTQKEAYAKEHYKDKILISGGTAAIVINYNYTMQELYDDFYKRDMADNMSWGANNPIISNYGYDFIFDKTGKKLIRIDIDWYKHKVCKFIKMAIGSDSFKVKGIWHK